MLVFFVTSEFGFDRAEDLLGNQDNVIHENERAKMAQKTGLQKSELYSNEKDVKARSEAGIYWTWQHVYYADPMVGLKDCQAWKRLEKMAPDGPIGPGHTMDEAAIHLGFQKKRDLWGVDGSQFRAQDTESNPGDDDVIGKNHRKEGAPKCLSTRGVFLYLTFLLGQAHSFPKVGWKRDGSLRLSGKNKNRDPDTIRLSQHNSCMSAWFREMEDRAGMVRMITDMINFEYLEDEVMKRDDLAVSLHKSGKSQLDAQTILMALGNTHHNSSPVGDQPGLEAWVVLGNKNILKNYSSNCHPGDLLTFLLCCHPARGHTRAYMDAVVEALKKTVMYEVADVVQKGTKPPHFYFTKPSTYEPDWRYDYGKTKKKHPNYAQPESKVGSKDLYRFWEVRFLMSITTIYLGR